MAESPITLQDQDKLDKIIRVMESSTHSGEKKAARAALERMANRYGLNHKEILSSQKSKKNQSKSASSAFWKEFSNTMTTAQEQAAKYRWQCAVNRAREQEEAENPPSKASVREPYTPYKSYYRQTDEDKKRCILALAREGVPLRRIVEATGATSYEVASILLRSREASKQDSKIKRGAHAKRAL